MTDTLPNGTSLQLPRRACHENRSPATQTPRTIALAD